MLEAIFVFATLTLFNVMAPAAFTEPVDTSQASQPSTTISETTTKEEALIP